MAADPGELSYRLATADDVPLLAAWNRELIDDEGHDNRMTVPELAARMRSWLAGDYRAALFSRAGEPVAYVLYVVEPWGVYVRHLFVARHARRQGIATAALRHMARDVWPVGTRVSLDVLLGNAGARAFYEALGFEAYALTLRAHTAALALGPDGDAAE